MASSYKNRYVQFYADGSYKGETYRNKPFKMRVNGKPHAYGCLRRFERYGNRIRAAWYVDTSEGINERL